MCHRYDQFGFAQLNSVGSAALFNVRILQYVHQLAISLREFAVISLCAVRRGPLCLFRRQIAGDHSLFTTTRIADCCTHTGDNGYTWRPNRQDRSAGAMDPVRSSRLCVATQRSDPHFGCTKDIPGRHSRHPLLFRLRPVSANNSAQLRTLSTTLYKPVCYPAVSPVKMRLPTSIDFSLIRDLTSVCGWGSQLPVQAARRLAAGASSACH
jgi:hypothetical protein